MKKLLIGLLALALTAAACGGGDDDSASPFSSGDDGASDQAPADDGGSSDDNVSPLEKAMMVASAPKKAVAPKSAGKAVETSKLIEEIIGQWQNLLNPNQSKIAISQ